MPPLPLPYDSCLSHCAHSSHHSSGLCILMFVSLFSPIFTSWDIVNDNDTDVISPFHLRHIIDLCLATQTTLIDYLNFLRYLQQSLKFFPADCNVILLFKLPSTWNLIYICKSAYWNNVWESCQIIGRLYFPEELRRNSIYSCTFLSYPALMCYPITPEKGKVTKRNYKGICL